VTTIFGAAPPDYAVKIAFDGVQESKATLESFERALRREAFSGELQAAYREVYEVDPDISQRLRWVATAAGTGHEAAILQAKKAARDDLQEIEEQARREEIASLPESWREVIDDSKDGDSLSDVYQLARVFGGYSRCEICDEMIVSPSDLAESIVEHYELEDEEADEARAELTDRIANSGAEVGTFADDGLCSYHNYVTSKDD
jgi:hypothetical protein